MTTISITISKTILQKMQQFYNDCLTNNSNQYIIFQAKTIGCTITAYTSLKVVFQGENAQKEAMIWQSQENTTIEKKAFKEHIGSDEVGTGDYFGPITTCACYLSKQHIKLISSLKIDDSKILKDDYILEIAPKLIKEIPHSILVLNNEKYNELVQKGYNLNKIKAYLHNQCYLHLLKKINLNCEIIMDQFAPEKLYYSYLKDCKEVVRNIHFETKAESKYLAVALSSIIARYYFLKAYQQLETSLNTKLPKGASNLVDQKGAELVSCYGENILMKIAKYNFKNTEKIKQIYYEQNN